MLKELRTRLRGLLRRSQVERELDEELQFHVQAQTEQNIRLGMDPKEARAAALRNFGGLEQSKELSRDARRIWMIEEVWQDLRYGARMMVKHRGFTLVAVLSLALGIGANTTIFSLANKALLRPLPIEEPARMVAVSNTSLRGRMSSGFSYANYRDLRDRNDVLTGLLAYEPAPASLSHDGINERVWGYLVSGNYFDLLGAKAALGRLFSPEDDRAPGAHPVAVISHRAWLQRFGGNPDLIGRNLIVNGRTFTVIGVAPPNFIGLELSYVPEIWFPIMMRSEIRTGAQSGAKIDRSWLEDRGRGGFNVAGRLKPGVDVAQAQASMKSLAAQLEREYPNDNEGQSVELSPPGLWGAGGRQFMLGFSGVLLGVAGLVLLLVCTNLANLLLARGLDRRQEIAVRLALGASRARVVRQLLTESLMLSSVGSIFGLWLAYQLVRVPGSFKLPMALSFALDIDWRVVIYTIAITFVTGAAFGLLPAWQATKQDLVPALKDAPSSSGYRRSWMRNTLVVAQIAFSLILMIAAGLAMRGLQRSQSVNLGFNPQQAVKASFDLTLQGYERERGRQFQRQIVDRVRALPGVQTAAVGNYVPPDLHGSMFSLSIEGQPPARSGELPRVGGAFVGPGYFQALGTHLLAGRDFTEQDDEKAIRVAVINETFARRFWPGESAIGKRFSLPGRGRASIEVVGIVEDGKYRSLSEAPLSFVFVPLAQSYDGLTMLVVRTSGESAQVIAAVRRELQQLDPYLPIFDDETLTEHLQLSLMPARLIASLLGGVGALSLSLAAIGIFGVMSYTVSRRTHEVGVRMALGAKRIDVLWLVVRQGMTLAMIGLALGLGAALTLTQLMKSLLVDVSAYDPLTFVSVTSLLIGVSLVACLVPARRATRVDPLIALRHE